MSSAPRLMPPCRAILRRFVAPILALVAAFPAHPVAAAVPDSTPAFVVLAVVRDDKAFDGAHDVEVRDGYAYTAGKGGALAVVDVREPAAPRIVWSVHDPQEYDDAETVLPLGDRLFVGTRDLALFDVSRPEHVRRLALVRDRKHINRINGAVRVGEFILSANKDGFVVVARWDGGDGLDFRGARPTSGDGVNSPHDLDVAGRLLVVADGNGFGRDGRPGRVAVYRFRESVASDPWPPDEWKLVDRVEDVRLAGCNRVRVKGTVAIAACSISPAAAGQPARRGATHLVDLAEPDVPRIAGVIDFTDTRGPNGLCVAGSVAFVCGGRTVQAIGLTAPDRPTLLGSIDLTKELPGGADDLHDADYRDGRLYVTAQTSDALVVLEVADPTIREAADRK